jgi:ATP-dependent RNA helicase DDX54/DBP10
MKTRNKKQDDGSKPPTFPAGAQKRLKSELKSANVIRKERMLKDKRREKNARPSRKGKKK